MPESYFRLRMRRSLLDRPREAWTFLPMRMSVPGDARHPGARQALPGPQLPIGTHLHDAVALVDCHGGECGAAERNGLGAEVEPVVLDEQRQVAHHRIFDAAADRIARPRSADVGSDHAGAG